MITCRRSAAAESGKAVLFLILLLALAQCGTEDPAAPAQPAVGVSASSVEFAGEVGGADPQAFVVNVVDDGAKPLTGLSVRVEEASGKASDWLSATLSGAATPANLTITARTGGLEAGTYAATVTVMTDVAGIAPQPIAISVTVAPPGMLPTIEVPTSSVLFVGTEGDANPPPQTVPVTAGGGKVPLTGLAASVSYTAGQQGGWLTATLDRKKAPSVLRLQADIGNLVAGAYTADVALTSPKASNSPEILTVTLRMTTDTMPTIALSPTDVSLAAGVGGADPLPAEVAVSNGGGRSLTGLTATIAYAAGQPQDWLAASLGETTAPTSLVLQATAGELAEGTYTATVAVAADVATNSPQTVTVRFTVMADAPQAIVLPTGSIMFICTVGEPTLTQTLSVQNGAGGKLTDLAADIVYAPGQPKGWLTAELAGTTAPTVLRVLPVYDGLAPGIYDATVLVSSPVAGNSPQELGVRMYLTSSPR